MYASASHPFIDVTGLTTGSASNAGFVDGALVHQENGSRGALPTHPQRIMMNLWPGVGVDGWLQPFT